MQRTQGVDLRPRWWPRVRLGRPAGLVGLVGLVGRVVMVCPTGLACLTGLITTTLVLPAPIRRLTISRFQLLITVITPSQMGAVRPH